MADSKYENSHERDTDCESQKSSGSSLKSLPIFKEDQGDSFSTRYDVAKLFRGLKRHPIIIVICALICSVFGYVAEKNYLSLQKGESVVLYQELAPKGTTDDVSNAFSLSTALDMIKLPSNLQAVKSILGLDLDVKAIEGMVEVPTPRSSSNLIRIVAKGDNPNLVVDVANTLAQVAIKSSREFNQRMLQLALDNYKNQLEIVRLRLASQMQDIEKFKTEHKYLEMTADNSLLLQYMTESKRNLQEAKLRYNSLSAEYDNLKKEVTSLPEKIEVTAPESAAQVVATPYESRINSLEGALLEARTRYAKNNPKLIQLEQELKDLQKKSEAFLKELPEKEQIQLYESNKTKEELQVELLRMESKIHSAKKAFEETTATYEAIDKDIQKLPSVQVAFAKLLQAKEMTETQLRFLNNAVDQTQLRINVPKGSLELYYLGDKAKPYKDSWWVYLLPYVGAFFGFGIGCIFSLFIEMEDRRIWTSKQVNMAYHIPYMLTIPEMPFLSVKNAEQKMIFFIRGIAERLGRIANEKGLTTPQGHANLSIAILSSTDKEGKSCIATNLARYYERIGKKVVMLQFDERPNPFISTLENEATIEAFLKGSLQLRDIVIQNHPDIIRVKGHDPNMKEMVKTAKMKELWNFVKNEYEVIIIDTPGLIKEDFAANIAELADLSVFVVGGKQTDKSKVNHSLAELSLYGVRPCGIILNRVLPNYIDDSRIKQYTQKSRKDFWKQLFAFGKKE